MTTSSIDAPTRGRLPHALVQNPVIAVLRAPAARAYDAVVDTLVENGIRSIELTLSTPDTLERLPALLERCAGSGATIGVGTVTSPDQARAALAAGAQYLVTPVLDVEVIGLALAAGVPVFPGAFSPTEVFAAWRAGATAVKIFPAETVGPQYGGHLRGPFPGIRFVPSGGVAIDDVPAWIRAGACAVSLGGPLVGDALDGGSLPSLAERCLRVNAVVDEELGR